MTIRWPCSGADRQSPETRNYFVSGVVYNDREARDIGLVAYLCQLVAGGLLQPCKE